MYQCISWDIEEIKENITIHVNQLNEFQINLMKSNIRALPQWSKV